MIPGPQSGGRYVGVDMYNPNKIIGLRTSIIRGFQSEDKPFSYIDHLVHNNNINSQDVRDGNSYKVQLKLNEVIEKLNEMNDKNRELEEKILQMETSSQNQINAMRRLSNVGNKLTRGRRRISRSNRHRSLSREQGVNIGRHLLQSSA